MASESPEAARAAMAQLRAGGSAADAAVTAALVAGVSSPSSSGIGGGAFIHYWDAEQGRSIVLDAREVAPAAIEADAFEARPFAAEQRGRWVGVPGELRGLSELHSRFGRRSWAQVVTPAVETARKGFEVSAHLSRVLGYAQASLRVDAGLKALWYPGGKPLETGARVKNPALAGTLERIAQQGAGAFYEGELARDIVDSVRAHGGAMTLDDLQAYRVIERTALKKHWEGYDVYTMPLPSAGGMMLVQTLSLFSKAELQRLGFNTPAYQHALAEAFRGAIADRLRHAGDPDFEAVDMARLLDGERLARRRAGISMHRTQSFARFAQPEHGTHHLITADAQGNVASVTTTINRGFGSKITTARSGIVLNDELDDFTPSSWVRGLGLEQSPNRPRPGARPVSSMTPTIVVRDGRVVLAAGGSGGLNIATDVSQTVVSQLAFGMRPTELLDTPRFQIPLRDATIAVVKEASSTHVADLRFRGEVVETIRFTSTAVQLITRDEAGWDVAADPRKFGLALAR